MESEFYPPRARWYSRLLNAGAVLRREWRLPSLPWPSGLSVSRLLLALAVPGYTYVIHNKRRLAQAVGAAYVLAGLVALIGFGTGLATGAYGLMMALHAVCWITTLRTLASDWSGWSRLAAPTALALLLGVWIYLPVLRWVQQEWVLPLQMQDRLVLVARRTDPRRIGPGDWIVYRVEASSRIGLNVRGGYALGEVRAMGGEVVTFSARGGRVGQRQFPARPLMPDEGEWLVPENHWFIWPESGMEVRGNAGAGPAAARTLAMMDIALVPESRLIGRPLRRWFWRRFEIP